MSKYKQEDATFYILVFACIIKNCIFADNNKKKRI